MRLLQGEGAYAQALRAPRVPQRAPQGARQAHGGAPALQRRLRRPRCGQGPAADSPEGGFLRAAEARAHPLQRQPVRGADGRARAQARQDQYHQGRPGVERTQGDHPPHGAGGLGQGRQDGVGCQEHDRRRGVPAQGAALADGDYRPARAPERAGVDGRGDGEDRAEPHGDRGGRGVLRQRGERGAHRAGDGGGRPARGAAGGGAPGQLQP